MSYPDMYIKKENLPPHLCQGDVIKNFDETLFIDFKPKELGLMILTYTCDLSVSEELTFISYCPIYSFDTVMNKYLELHKNKNPENTKAEIYKNFLRYVKTNKFTFFLAPIPEFHNNPAFSFLGQIASVNVKHAKLLLDNRIISLQNPWREKLGYMIGNLYNRVATEDLDKGINYFVNNYEPLTNYLLETIKPSVDFLLESIKEISLKDSIRMIDAKKLEDYLKERNLSWKRDFMLPKKKALNTLVERAKSFLELEKTEGELVKIGLKKQFISI